MVSFYKPSKERQVNGQKIGSYSGILQLLFAFCGWHFLVAGLISILIIIFNTCLQIRKGSQAFIIIYVTATIDIFFYIHCMENTFLSKYTSYRLGIVRAVVQRAIAALPMEYFKCIAI